MVSFEKLLIERVRQIDLLYNTRTILYKNPEKRERSWLIISKQLGVKVEHCRQRWKSLRDRFVREHKKVLSGDLLPGSEPWEHYNQMLFLKDYLRTRNYNLPEFSDNIPEVHVKLEETDRAELLLDNSEFKTEGTTTKLQTDYLECKTEDGEFNSSGSLHMPPETEFSDGGNYSLEDMSNSTETPGKKFKSDVEDVFVDFIGGMSRLVDKKQNAHPPPEETENMLFMKMIAKKLDLLPITSQGSLQIEILTLVNNEVNKYVTQSQN